MVRSHPDFLKELPPDLDGEVLRQGQMDEFFQSLSHRPVPVGRISRLLPLGATQVKIGLGYLAYWMRSPFLSAPERKQQLTQANLDAAVKMLHCMSYLRGSFLKLGQAIANFPSVVPTELADTLGRLHFEAPPMHYSLLREHVSHELGADPEDIFAEFETTAFAAASLGQVHRARLKSGERVAVKIQYPNIARTIREDFKNLNALLWPVRLGEDWENFREQMADILHVLEQETDYLREAQQLQKARCLFQPDEGIVIPRVFGEYSTRRILTMEYLDGLHINAYLATNPAQAECDQHGARIVRSAFRLMSLGRMCYGDPHPGNYLFLPDGRLGMIDFGCCRDLSDEEFDYVFEVEASCKNSPEKLKGALLKSVGYGPDDDLDPDLQKALQTYIDWVWEPLRVDGAFDFGNEQYLQRGMEILMEIIGKRYTRSQPVNNWLNRNFLGIRSMALRLKARVNMRQIEEEEAP